MTSAPAGALPFAATLRILSFSTTTSAFAITRWPSHNLPNLSALTAASASSETATRSATTSAPNLNISIPQIALRSRYQRWEDRTSPGTRDAENDRDEEKDRTLVFRPELGAKKNGREFQHRCISAVLVRQCFSRHRTQIWKSP